MKKIFSILGVGLFAVTSMLIYNGCSSSGGSDNPGSLNNRPETITYTGPGSFYSIVMNNDGTCEVEIRENYDDADPIFTVACEFEPLDNGVLELTVTGVDPDDAEDGPTIGEKAHAIEIVGFGVFLLPLGGDEIIPMLSSGSCPDDDFNANWIVAQRQRDDEDSTSDEQDYFGTFSYDVGSDTGEVTAKRALADGFPEVTSGSDESITGECSDGFLSLSDEMTDDPISNLWLTTNGGAIVQTFEQNMDTMEFETSSAIVAFPRQTNDIADMEGTFRGMLFQGGDGDVNSDDANNFFVEMTFNDSGEGTGRQVTSINPWETGDDAATITLEDASDIGPGWYTGVLSVPDEADANIACSFISNIDSTTLDALLCVGQSPGDIAEDNDNPGSINFLMVKQD
ncbi:MAG: hypothetical protein KDD46_01790 [Bdellovibrionales bacterium]|nr:hypothetical protein [Bdellovibrionales bacterium]